MADKIKIPKRLYLPSEFREYFPDYDVIYDKVWKMDNVKVLQAYDDNWYELQYVSGTKSKQEYIKVRKQKD